MAGSDRTEISQRLRSLPRQLLLALINATAILVIVAAVLVLVALSRLNNVAANVAATMTEAVLSRVDLPAKDALANLRNLTAEVRALGNTLREIRSGDHSIIQAEIARLNETLTGLNTSVDRLADAKLTLTDEAVVRLGQAVTDTLLKLRHCSSTAGQAAPRNVNSDALAATLVPSALLRHARGSPSFAAMRQFRDGS